MEEVGTATVERWLSGKVHWKTAQRIAKDEEEAARENAKAERRVALEAAHAKAEKPRFVPPNADKYLVGAKLTSPPEEPELEEVPIPECSSDLKSSLRGVIIE